MADRLDVDGPAAPPRDNGELVFTAPWQGRAFAVAVALSEGGHISWEDFRHRLISELAGTADGEPGTYWGAWLRATEGLLAQRALVDGSDARQRLAAYAARPAGHDHDHDHGGHEHDHGGHEHDHGIPLQP